MQRNALTLTLTLLLSGCNLENALLLSSEDRINSAYPLPASLLEQKDSLLDAAPSSDKNRLTAQLEEKLKSRADHCSNGYYAKWLESPSEIRKNVSPASCFENKDKLMAKWLGFLHLGATLRLPALREIPRNTLSIIPGSQFIQSAYFAEKAGIALLETINTVEVVDIGQSKKIWSGDKNGADIGNLSSNGRIFLIEKNETLSFLESESGKKITDIPNARAWKFHWLDNRTAIYTNSESNRSFLVDLESGEEALIPNIDEYVEKAIAVPDSDDTYVLMHSRNISKLKVTRKKSQPELAIIDHKSLSLSPWSSNTSGPVSGTNMYFGINTQLVFFRLKDMNPSLQSFYPFQLSTGFATPEQDSIILVGSMPGTAGKPRQSYLYSIKQKTLQPIDTSKLSSTRYQYVSSLKRLAVINDDRIEIIEKLPTLDAIPIYNFITSAIEQTNQQQANATQQEESNAALRYRMIESRLREHSYTESAPSAPPRGQ